MKNRTTVFARLTTALVLTITVAAPAFAQTGPAGNAAQLNRLVDEPEKPYRHQLFYDGLDIDPATSYNVTFRAKASAPTRLAVSTKNSQPPWAFFGVRENIEIGTTWELHTLPFRGAGAIPNASRLTFNFGNADAVKIWIADVAITPAGGGANVLPDGQFTKKLGDWRTRGGAWVPDGTQAGVYEVTLVPAADGAAASAPTTTTPPASPAATAVTNSNAPAGNTVQLDRLVEEPEKPYRHQLFYDGINLDPSANYTVTFWAKASAPTRLAVSTKNSQPPWAFFGVRENIEIGTTWELHTLPFSGAGAIPNASRLTFNFGNADAVKIWIADVAITPAGGSTNLVPDGQFTGKLGDWKTHGGAWVPEGRQAGVYDVTIAPAASVP
ncbi:hypothetical protein OpiT1DRAFT_01547 [Opitutaceae bacterium TAV1]|nr:hypothetical protein OpiT1DRAFT_01547 [Opitutaceae bacterium TAV1]